MHFLKFNQSIFYVNVLEIHENNNYKVYILYLCIKFKIGISKKFRHISPINNDEIRNSETAYIYLI